MEQAGPGDDIPFRLAMENSAIGMTLVAPNGAFITVNSALCTMLGRDEVTLKACTWQELTHPDDLSGDEALVAELLAGRRDSYRLLKRFVRPDGSLLWGDLSVACVRDEAGSVDYFISQIVDVTEAVSARARIEESEARYRLLAENASDVVTLINVDGTLEWVSPSLTRSLGWAAEDVVGRPSWDVIHTEDHPEVARILSSDADGIHGIPDVEIRLRRADGSYVRFLAAGNFVNEAQMVVNLRLFEEQARAREELRLSEERYRLLAENASDIVLQTGPSGLLEWVSPSVRDVLGWHPDDLVGRRYSELVHPEDVAEGRRRQKESLRTGKAPSVLEARIATADGGWLWMADRGRPVFDEHGALIGGIDALRDVHAEIEARQALRASEAHYRLLADNATDVVYVVDPVGRVTWISPTVEQTLGWAPDELMGTVIHDLIHDDDRARVDALWADLSAGQQVATPAGGWTLRFRRRDGSYLWMALKTTTIRNEDGSMQSGVTGLQDVDALVKAREMAEAEEARLQATLDSLLDPHVLLHAVRDDDGTISDFVYAEANDAACAYMRMSRDELEGQRLLTLLPGQAGSGMLAMYSDAIESGQPLALDDYAYLHEILEGERRYDIRAIRVGDSLSFTWRDVTERSEAAARIAESERHFRLLADNSSDVVLHSRDGIVLWVSPSLKRTLGWTPSEVIGTDSLLLVHPDDLAALYQGGASQADSHLVRVRLLAKSGEYHWCEVHSSDYLDEDGQPNGIVASFRTIDQEVAAERELERRATRDDLTGAFKREEVLVRLAQISAVEKATGRQAAVLFCDVDNLKQINDENGHAAGDELLRALAYRIQQAVRSTDTVARVGGDEFLVILDQVAGLAEGKAIAEKVRAAAVHPVLLEHGAVSSSLSIGLTMTRPGEDPEETISRADRAMYAAKRAGRNTVKALNSP